MLSARKMDCQVVTLMTVHTIAGILYRVTRLDQGVFENNNRHTLYT